MADAQAQAKVAQVHYLTSMQTQAAQVQALAGAKMVAQRGSMAQPGSIAQPSAMRPTSDRSQAAMRQAHAAHAAQTHMQAAQAHVHAQVQVLQHLEGGISQPQAKLAQVQAQAAQAQMQAAQAQATQAQVEAQVQVLQLELESSTPQPPGALATQGTLAKVQAQAVQAQVQGIQAQVQASAAQAQVQATQAQVQVAQAKVAQAQVQALQRLEAGMPSSTGSLPQTPAQAAQAQATQAQMQAAQVQAAHVQAQVAQTQLQAAHVQAQALEAVMPPVPPVAVAATPTSSPVTFPMAAQPGMRMGSMSEGSSTPAELNHALTQIRAGILQQGPGYAAPPQPPETAAPAYGPPVQDSAEPGTSPRQEESAPPRGSPLQPAVEAGNAAAPTADPGGIASPADPGLDPAVTAAATSTIGVPPSAVAPNGMVRPEAYRALLAYAREADRKVPPALPQHRAECAVVALTGCVWVLRFGWCHPLIVLLVGAIDQLHSARKRGCSGCCHTGAPNSLSCGALRTTLKLPLQQTPLQIQYRGAAVFPPGQHAPGI